MSKVYFDSSDTHYIFLKNILLFVIIPGYDPVSLLGCLTLSYNYFVFHSPVFLLYNNAFEVKKKKPGNYLLSHTLTRVVPSAMRGLTSLFGMGRGVTPSLRSPGIKLCNTQTFILFLIFYDLISIHLFVKKR